MPKRVLDTGYLVAHWRQRKASHAGQPTVADVEAWARELSVMHQAKAIVTPIHVEFLVGTRDSPEQRLAEAFLAQFDNIDGGNIPKEDWDETLRIAKRIPPTGKPRQLGDCLIRAIANRLKHTVITPDTGFPK
jgi:predicted nucleic acid-binding protein